MACDLSMASRPITVVLGMASTSSCCDLLAVTTTSGKATASATSWAPTEKEQISAPSATTAPKRARENPVFIKIEPSTRALAVFPDSAWTSRLCDARTATVLAGIRAGGTNSIAFPSACSRRSVAVMEPEPGSVRPLTVAGAAQVRLADVPPSLLLPVELRHANHSASTNGPIVGGQPDMQHAVDATYNAALCTPSPPSNTSPSA